MSELPSSSSRSAGSHSLTPPSSHHTEDPGSDLNSPSEPEMRLSSSASQASSQGSSARERNSAPTAHAHHRSSKPLSFAMQRYLAEPQFSAPTSHTLSSESSTIHDRDGSQSSTYHSPPSKKRRISTRSRENNSSSSSSKDGHTSTDAKGAGAVESSDQSRVREAAVAANLVGVGTRFDEAEL